MKESMGKPKKNSGPKSNASNPSTKAVSPEAQKLGNLKKK